MKKNKIWVFIIKLDTLTNLFMLNFIAEINYISNLGLAQGHTNWVLRVVTLTNLFMGVLHPMTTLAEIS